MNVRVLTSRCYVPTREFDSCLYTRSTTERQEKENIREFAEKHSLTLLSDVKTDWAKLDEFTNVCITEVEVGN